MAAIENVSQEQQRFFKAIFGDEAGYVFISTLDHEKKARGEDHFWSDRPFAWPAQRPAIVDFIHDEDERGCDVYFAVQLYGKPDARQKVLVKSCPSVWSDLDFAVPWTIDPEPSVILETSPGRYHGFWRAPSVLSPSEAENISKRIAYAHHADGADLGGWDLTQVLRIPGTHNHKYDGMPEVRLLKCDPKPIPRATLERFPVLIDADGLIDPWGDDLLTDEPPIPLIGWDLAHWQLQETDDRSSWAQRMVAILKEHGLSDRLAESALIDHPIYLAKAAEKWGGKRSAIVQDIRRCIKHWREHPIQTTIIRPLVDANTNGQASQNGAVHLEQSASDYPLQTLYELVTSVTTSDEQLIERLLWSRRVTWIFAPASTGKTMFVLASLLHLAAERPFCGRAIQSGAVMLIEEDSPLSVMAEYVDTVADIYEIDLKDVPFWINKEQGLRIIDDVGLERAKRAVERCPVQPLVVAIDACERLTPSDRFNSREFDPLVRFLQWLVSRGITPIVIDHTKKQGAEPKKNEPPKKPLDELYGAVAKQQIADVMIYFAGSLKTSIRVTFEKFRGETPAGFTATFSGDAGFVIRDARYAPVTEAERKIAGFCQGAAPGSSWVSEDLFTATNLKERTFYRALSSLVKHQFLLKSGDSAQAPRYALNLALPGPFS